MALNYHPRIGEILLCDFHGFVVPEMVKRRPVVVVVPRLPGRGDLVTIVPLSTTAPRVREIYHVPIELDRPLPSPFSATHMWAKCDMIIPVARSRLDRFKAGHAPDGRRRYVTGAVSGEQLQAIRYAILHGLGLDSLTKNRE